MTTHKEALRIRFEKVARANGWTDEQLKTAKDNANLPDGDYIYDSTVYYFAGFQACEQSMADDGAPVAYAEQDNVDMHSYDDLSFSYPVSTKPTENRTVPLFTHPAKRLSENELYTSWVNHTGGCSSQEYMEIADAIQDRLLGIDK